MTEGNGNVSEFFNGAVILITGGTGFLGKLLVEKLIRTFNIECIYLLVRNKNNQTVEERMKSYVEETVFDRIRNESPKVLEKIIAIHANYNSMNLDITEDMQELLCDRVNIVFNIVASVKFNERLRDAIEINVVGTKKILDLSMGMRKLKAFLHISTLYSNCNRNSIGEKVYNTGIDYEKIIEMTRILDDYTLEKIQHCLIGEMPNTYTMTKRCSENLVNHKAYSMPAGIFRPPIVLSTYREPVPGWTDNLYGPSGLCAWTARGFIHCIHGDPKKKANLVPADYCINAMIACAWDVNRRFHERIKLQLELPVYNYIYDNNNLTWGRYMNLVRKGLHEPLDKALWYFSYGIIPSKPLYNVATFLCHTIPGYLLDVAAFISGQKRIYASAYRKMKRVITMMSYFGLREWTFQNNNIDELSNLLVNRDKRDLPFDMNTIDWNEYFFNYMPGIKKYFYKENYKNIEKCKKHYRRLRMLHVAMKSIFWLLCLTGTIKLFSKVIFLCMIKK